jgi:HK97 family phage major capsid protein
MPFTHELPENPSLADVVDGLRAAGDYLAGLNRRDDVDPVDARSAIEFIDRWDRVAAAWARADIPTPSPASPPAVATRASMPTRRSLGETVASDDRYLAAVGGFAGRSIELVYQRSLLTRDDVDSSTGGAFVPPGEPQPPRPAERRLWVRDLIPVIPTTLASVPFIVESHAGDTDAAPVAEGAAKPEASMAWDLQDAPVRKIAAWVPVTTEILDDAPTLAGYVDRRLRYLVDLAVERQVISGSGTPPQLRGLLNTTGIGSQTFTSDAVTTIGLAIGKVEAAGGIPNGVLINPVDFWQAVTTRHANQFDAVGSAGLPFGAAPQSLWGVPVVRSSVVPAGTAIVADFQLAATILDRQATTVRLGNQHADFFTTNRVAIVAECRIALAVHRPDAIIETALS